MGKREGIIVSEDETARQEAFMHSVRELNPEADKKYMICTFGCQMNENDSEKLAGMLEAMGYTSAGRGIAHCLQHSGQLLGIIFIHLAAKCADHILFIGFRIQLPHRVHKRFLSCRLVLGDNNSFPFSQN